MFPATRQLWVAGRVCCCLLIALSLLQSSARAQATGGDDPAATSAPVNATAGGAGAGGPSQDVCLLTLRINRTESPFEVGGESTQPLSSVISRVNMSEALSVQGVVQVALYNQSTCPSNLTDLLAALGGSGLVTTMGADGKISPDEGVLLEPGVVPVVARAAQGGAVVAHANLTDLQFYLYSPQPWPADVGAAGGASAAPTDVTLAHGAITIMSEVVGNRIADFTGVSSPAPVDVVLQPGADNRTLTVLLRNVAFLFPLGPETVPGADFAAANLSIMGNITAVAVVPDDLSVVPLADVQPPNITSNVVIRPLATATPPQAANVAANATVPANTTKPLSVTVAPANPPAPIAPVPAAATPPPPIAGPATVVARSGPAGGGAAVQSQQPPPAPPLGAGAQMLRLLLAPLLGVAALAVLLP